MTTQGSINILIRLKDRLKGEVTDNQTIMAALDIAIDALKADRLYDRAYVHGWRDALSKALDEEYNIHCEEGNFKVVQSETLIGLGMSKSESEEKE